MAEYVFLADLTVLKSNGDIDVILGMDWLELYSLMEVHWADKWL